MCFDVCQGNYDQYIQTRLELEENQMKKYNWEQDQIAHMKVRMSIPPIIILILACYVPNVAKEEYMRSM